MYPEYKIKDEIKKTFLKKKKYYFQEGQRIEMNMMAMKERGFDPKNQLIETILILVKNQC